MRSRLLLAVVMLLLATSCSATGRLEVDRAAVVDPTAAPEPATPAPVVPAETTPELPASDVPDAPQVGAPANGEPASDRIVVGTSDGQVYLVDPDGERRLDLSRPGAAGQPVWSPDGRRIAWSQRDPSGFSITSANADGTEQRRAKTLFSGYFGYWSPTSRWLGFLGNAPPGTGLVLDAGTGSDLDSVVDSDTFYYFSWSPDGTRWVVHSGSGLSIVSLDGTRTPLDLEAGRFRAPTWSNDGSILLALRSENGNMIVRFDPETSTIEELLEVGDVTNFVLDPTGRYLAIESLVFEDGQTDPGEGITISTTSQSASSQPTRSGAEVLVYDLDTGEVVQILSGGTGGFWWSPDGKSLAILVEEQASPPTFAQWLVWSADESFRTDRFRVTGSFASAYVPFYDQFAQSVTPWSPDSSRFVYSGFDEQGDSGVFVQPARADTPPQRISDDAGVAFWSPT